MGICIVTILFLFSCNSKVDAKAPNVLDCLEDNAACEEDTGDKKPNKPVSEADTEADTDTSGSLVFSIVKTVFALLLVLALIYLLLKFLNKRNKLFSQVKALENLGGISVGQSKSIQVVRIGTKVFLVGVGENVELLQEITDEEVKKDLINKDGFDSNTNSTTHLLPSFLQPKKDKQNGENNFNHLFSKELEKLKKNREIMKQQKEDKHE